MVTCMLATCDQQKGRRTNHVLLTSIAPRTEGYEIWLHSENGFTQTPALYQHEIIYYLTVFCDLKTITERSILGTCSYAYRLACIRRMVFVKEFSECPTAYSIRTSSIKPIIFPRTDESRKEKMRSDLQILATFDFLTFHQHYEQQLISSFRNNNIV